MEQGDVGAIHYGQLYTKYGSHADTTYSFVTSEVASKLKKVHPGDLIVTNTSENFEDVGTAFAWLGDEDIVTGGHTTTLRHQMVPKYLAYWFQTYDFEFQKQKVVFGAKVSELGVKALAKFLVPNPPLEIQQEIVRILDLFVDLDRELEQEIIGRERQKIATSHALFEKLKHFPRIALKNAGTWFGGGTPSKKNESFWQNGTIAWVSPKDMHDHTVTRTIDYITDEAVEGSSTKLVPAGSTALVARSSILEKKLPVAYFPQEVAMNQDLKAVFPSDELNGRYLFNALEEFRESILLRARNTGGSAASLDTKRLMAFEIPLPPLEVQEEIASKLDTFIEYIDNLKRERELRQKQYAHYRDLLLDLPVKE